MFSTIRLYSINSRISRALFLRTFYEYRTKNDTIFAPATSIDPKKGSPLAVIRISGQRTEAVLKLLTKCDIQRYDKYIKSSSGSKIIKPRYATKTEIYLPSDENEVLDIGMILWFPSPRSYTGEDVCELHTHGSQSIVKELLEGLGKLDGLRPAEPGEFTRRAVENGKMTLDQAEGLSELIASRTNKQRKLALSGLDGTMRDKYNSWIDILVEILAHLEASIDFGEDELIGEERVVNDCVIEIRELSRKIDHFIRSRSSMSQFIKSGFRIAILGKPNAGKSSLMNILCQADKSIVSEVSGTTRDIIEHSFELNGHLCNICDTAGLDETEFLIERRVDECHIPDESKNKANEKMIEDHNTIERIGIMKAIEQAKKSDIILYMVDMTDLTSRSGIEKSCEYLNTVLTAMGNEKAEKIPRVIHLIVNKIDLYNLEGKNIARDLELSLRGNLDNNQMSNRFEIDSSSISCKTETNFSEFMNKLTNLFNKQVFQSDDNICTNGLSSSYPSRISYPIERGVYDFVNERHFSLLRAALKDLEKAGGMNLNNVDEMAEHVRKAVDYLSRIVGSISNDQVIDVIFRDFCIGK